MRLTKRKKVILRAIGLPLLALGIRAYFIFGPPSDGPIQFTLAKETTFLTEPLKPDGRPDYLKAINDRASAGIAAEDNGAVLFFQAVGPADVALPIRERFFAALGIPVLPEEGSYLRMWDVLEKRLRADPAIGDDDKIVDRIEEELRSRPWSATEFPAVAEWLAGNEQPLELLAQASRKPSYFVPFLNNNADEAIISMNLPDVTRIKNSIRVLLMRAMFHLGKNDAAAAWEDILVARRLSRFAGRGPCLVHSLIEITGDRMTAVATIGLLHDSLRDAALIARMREDLKKLPPAGRAIERIDFCERLCALDAAFCVAKDGPSFMTALADSPPATGFWQEFKRKWFNAGIHWDTALRLLNEWFDRAVAVYSLPPGPERRAAEDAFHRDLKDLKLNHRSMPLVTAAIIPLDSLCESNGRLMGSMILYLMLSATDAVYTAERRSHAVAAMVDIAFALAIYRAESGQYPDTLDALIPKYLPAAPVDVFSASSAPYRYRRTDDGYVIYSVGPNDNDDQGELESEEFPDADDVALWAGKKSEPQPQEADPLKSNDKPE